MGSIPPPHDLGGQVLIVALIVLGVGTLFYALVTATEFLVAGHLSGLLDERRIQRMIDALNDHYVICGFGRVGRQVARDLRAANGALRRGRRGPRQPGPGARPSACHFIEGRPSEDEILRAAGIERARAVLACVDSDAENIFITLSARELRDDITIVARASVEDSEKKLRRAGADRIISPYKASGSEMARLALHPQVTGAIDVAPEYRMEEIEVTAGAAGEGQTVGDVRGGSVIVALRRPDGTVQVATAGRHRARGGRRARRDGHAAHHRAAGGAVRAGQGRARGGRPGRVVTPLGDLRAAVQDAAAVHSRRRERRRLSADAGAGAPSRSSATTRRTPRCCSRRRSGSRRARSPRGWPRRWPSAWATGSTGPRWPGRASSTSSWPTPGTATRCAACWTPATPTAGASRRRASGSWSSSCRPTRPAR